MEQEQVGNADMAPESNIQESPFDADASDDFFSALDTSVNGGIQDEQELIQTTSVQGDNTPQSPSEVLSPCTEVVCISSCSS